MQDNRHPSPAAEKQMGLTADQFLNGRIIVRQRRNGYRFSMDAVILADYVLAGTGERVLDIGTGCGIIPLILGYRHPEVEIIGIEIQEDLAQIARRNIEENRMTERIDIRCADVNVLEKGMLGGLFDWVVSNPPFRKADSGRICADRQRAVARHELKLTLAELVGAGSRLLRKWGKLVIIYPAERLTDLLLEMRRCGTEPKYIRMIHSKPSTEAKLILVEAVKGGRPATKVGRPLIIYREDGGYTAEVARMMLP